MDSALDWHTARALLEWQVEMGVDECIGDEPVNRFEVAAEPPRQVELRPAEARTSQDVQAPNPASVTQSDAKQDITPVDVARDVAAGARDLNALREAMAAFEYCDLKMGARNLVFSDGLPGARVMILGEAPGRDEDRVGKPFVGRAGKLLDKMLEAIGLSRQSEDPATAAYITNVLPWRPPQNRDPLPAEIAMMLPFVQKHIELAAPDLIILMGNISCQAALGRRGILKLRGTWQQAFGRPAMPMTHPAYLLRQPHAKRNAWADLLEIRARLDSMK